MAEQKTIIALDIGKYAVKAVWAEHRRSSIKIKKAELMRLPQNTSDMLSIIKPWAEKIRLIGSSCILSLPAQDVIFQPLTLPPADPRSMDQAASIEVLRFNEMASEIMEYGYVPFKGSPGERRLLLAMARQSVVKPILATVNALNIKIIDLIPVPAAVFALFADNAGASETPEAFIEVGHSSTSLAIGASSELMFARAFPVGGKIFTEAIARIKKITFPQADSIKQTSSFSDSDNDVRKCLEESASLWVSELKSCLSVYANLFPARNARLARISITGAGSEISGFIEFIASKIDVPVSKAEINIEGLPPAQSSTFATAAGLAKTAILAKSEARLSLLPKHLRDELAFRKQKPYWIASAAIAGLTLATFLAGGAYDIKRKEKHLRIQRTGLARRQQLATKIEEVKYRIEQIQGMSSNLQSLLIVGPRIRDILAEISSLPSINGKDKITMICDADSYFNKKPFSVPRKPLEEDPARAVSPGRLSSSADTETTPQPINTIIIEGYTSVADFSTVRELIIKIASLDFVKSADLLSDDKLVIDENEKDQQLPPGFLRFVVEVKLKET